MRKFIRWVTMVCFMALFTPQLVFAQDEDKVVKKDEGIIFGRVLSISKEKVRINPRGSVSLMTIFSAQIERIEFANGEVLSFPVHADYQYTTESTKYEKPRKEKWYVKLLLPYNTIHGDFKGETIQEAPGVLLLVPKIENSHGFGISFGGLIDREISKSIRKGEKKAKASLLESFGEISYLRSTHDVSFSGGFESKATYNILNADMKVYSYFPKVEVKASELEEKRMDEEQLYGFGAIVLIGGNFSWLVVEDYSVTSTAVGDAIFRGLGLNLGGGLVWHLHPNISIDGEAIYRWRWFTAAEGADGINRKIEDSLRAHGFNYSAGVRFSF